MASLAEALRQHAPDYLQQLPRSKVHVHVRKTLQIIMRCRSGELGSIHYACTRCVRRHWAGRSCGNRHCATCGHQRTHQWLEKQTGRLLTAVHHFLVTFTVPKELRDVLRAHPRAGYEALFNSGADALRDVASATKSLKDAQLGFFGVLHTWGRDPLVYHPHVHFVVPAGGAVLDSQGKPIAWKSTPTNFLVKHSQLIRVYKAKLADALRAAGLYQLVPAQAWKKKFVVDIRPVDDGRSAVAYLAPCVHRVAISDHRIRSIDETSVTYQYQPKKSRSLKTRSVSGHEFVQGFAQHILPQGFRKVRYFGWMASNSRTKLAELRMLVWFSLGWVYWLASGHTPPAKPAKFPRLCCARCGAPLAIIGFSNEPVKLPLSQHALAYLDTG